MIDISNLLTDDELDEYKDLLDTADQMAKVASLNPFPSLKVILVDDINSVTDPIIGALYIQTSETETDIENTGFIFINKDSEPLIYEPPTKIKKEIKIKTIEEE